MFGGPGVNLQWFVEVLVTERSLEVFVDGSEHCCPLGLFELFVLPVLLMYTSYCNALCSCDSCRFWRVPSLCCMYWKERRVTSRNAPGQTLRPPLELAPPCTTPSNIKLNICCIIMFLLWMNEVFILCIIKWGKKTVHVQNWGLTLHACLQSYFMHTQSCSRIVCTHRTIAVVFVAPCICHRPV